MNLDRATCDLCLFSYEEKRKEKNVRVIFIHISWKETAWLMMHDHKSTKNKKNEVIFRI